MAGSGRRILVADDSSTIQKVIKIAFSRQDVEIVEASSFVEALAALGHWQPRAFILDASLPGAHGPADFARLTANAPGAPVLLLIGTYEAVDEAEFRQAGFQYFLKKPFESSELVDLVDSLLSDHEPEATLPQPTLTQATQAARVAHTTVIHPPGTFSGLSASTHETSSDRHPETRRTSEQAVPPPPPFVRRGALDVALSHSEKEAEVDSDAVGLSANKSEAALTDQARKGRPAFAPPPIASSEIELDMDPLPPLPKAKTPGLAERSDRRAPRAPGPHELAVDSPMHDSEPKYGSRSPNLSADIPATFDIKALVPWIEGQLPALVHQMVESYCERHFKGLARELILAELRRLADERARHLVDN